MGADPAWLVVGNGADELIGLIARAAFEPGDEVILPHPSFEPYHIEATLAGATPVASPLRDYETDLADVQRRVSPRTKAVFLCTPHNPASTLIARGPLRRFLDALGPDAPLVILDEAYRDFCDDPETPDGAALARDYPTVIALRTFSKIAGLAGLRVGYAIAQPPAIDRLNRVRAPYNVNRLAQVAALTALGDRAHLERTRALVLAERARLTGALRDRGAHVPPSQANFLLAPRRAVARARSGRPCSRGGSSSATAPTSASPGTSASPSAPASRTTASSRPGTRSPDPEYARSGPRRRRRRPHQGRAAGARSCLRMVSRSLRSWRTCCSSRVDALLGLHGGCPQRLGLRVDGSELGAQPLRLTLALGEPDTQEHRDEEQDDENADGKPRTADGPPGSRAVAVRHRAISNPAELHGRKV